MKKSEYDFGGWATKNDLLCADGRTIRRNAFRDDDGRTVPLVYQHNHEDPTRVIGHALLENRDEGVYAYCSLNATDTAQHVKECVRHGDINGLSIYANKLKQNGGDVLHGVIRELSVVLAGANPGAVIEFPLLEHGEESETEAYIWSGDTDISFGGGMKLLHYAKDKDEEDEEESEEDEEESEEDEEEADEETEEDGDDESSNGDHKPTPDNKVPEFIKKKRDEFRKHQAKNGELSHAEPEDDAEDEENDDETVQDILDSMNPEQRNAVEYSLNRVISGDDFSSPSPNKAPTNGGKTVADVLKTLNEKQNKVFEYLLENAEELAKSNAKSNDNSEDDDDGETAAHSYDYEDDYEGDYTMKRNVFDNDAMTEQNEDVLTHAQMDMILNDAKRIGSLRGSVLEHAAEYGIDQIDYLFPDYRNLTNTPGFISRDMGWVDKVMGAVSKTPFSRIKTMFADITEDQARARGYITKKLKKTEVFTLLKRTTDPQTIYKYQKLDRDDILDITDFDVVAWMKTEMRMMLNEEIARAILIGDGRDADSDDHINENHIRSVLRDSELFSLHYTVPVVADEDQAKTFIKTLRTAWEFYEGRGNCTAYMPESMLNKLKLLEDGIGHFLYPTNDTVASVLGVKEVVSVPVMKDKSTIRIVTSDTAPTKYYRPLAIIVNLGDYNVGADKGGSVNMFEDFDIKYNQNEYLIETRCSGALTRPHSAIVIEEEVAAPTTDDTNP